MGLTDLLTPREQLIEALLRLQHRADRLRADADDENARTAVAVAILDLEQLSETLNRAAEEQLYGVPGWLVESLEGVIDAIGEQDESCWAQVGSLLGVRDYSVPPSPERLSSLRAVARRAREASSPASGVLKDAFAATIEADGSTVASEAKQRASHIDVPMVVGPGGVLVGVSLRFDQADPEQPSVRSIRTTPDDPSVLNGLREFEGGIRDGIRAAQGLLIRLGVERDVRAQFAAATYGLRGVPADVPLVGRSAGLPIALEVLRRALELPRVADAASGGVDPSGALGEVGASGATKRSAVREDALHPRLVGNDGDWDLPAKTLDEAAFLTWDDIWVDTVRRCVTAKLPGSENLIDWDPAWADLRPRLVNGEPLVGQTGLEADTEGEVRNAHPGIRMVVGRRRSGKTFLVSQIANQLKSLAEEPWDVARILSREGGVPESLEQSVSDIRLGYPGERPLLIVLDLFALDDDDISHLESFEIGEGRPLLEALDASLLVTVQLDWAEPEADRASSFHALVAAQLDTDTTRAIARSIVESHPTLSQISPDEAALIAYGASGDVGRLVDRLAQRAAGEPRDDEGSSVARLHELIKTAPGALILRLASSSLIGLGTDAGELEGVDPQILSAIGAVREETGWRIADPETANDLIHAYRRREQSAGGTPRKRNSLAGDYLLARVESAMRDGDDEDVRQVLSGVARYEPALLDDLLRRCRLKEWASVADARALRGALMVAQQSIAPADGSAIATVLVEKLPSALRDEELTVLQTVRALKLLLDNWPEVLDLEAQGTTHRRLLVESLDSELPRLLSRGGPTPRLSLIAQVARLDPAARLVTRHMSAFLGELRPGFSDDYRLALRGLQRVRGLEQTEELTNALLEPAAALAKAVPADVPERVRAPTAVLRFALRVELEERHGIVLDTGVREQTEVNAELADEISPDLDGTGLKRLVASFDELMRVGRHRSEGVLTNLRQHHDLATKLSRRLRRVGPRQLAGFMKGLHRVSDKTAAAILFQAPPETNDRKPWEREPLRRDYDYTADVDMKVAVPRDRLVWGIAKKIRSNLDATGVVRVLEVTARVDTDWDRRDDGFAATLCRKLGAETLCELVEIHRRDRIVADLVEACVRARPGGDVLGVLAERAQRHLAKALIMGESTAWPARAALALGGDDDVGENFLDRLRDESGLRAALGKRMKHTSTPAFIWSHRIAGVLYPDLADEFAGGLDPTRLTAITHSRSPLNAVHAFEAVLFTLAQAGETDAANHVSALLAETKWSWRRAVALATSPTSVETTLRNLRRVHWPSAAEAISQPENTTDQDPLLGWMLRETRSPQARSDLLMAVAKIDPQRAEQLLSAYRNQHPLQWDRMLRATRATPLPRTRAKIYAGLAAAGFDLPPNRKEEELARWTNHDGELERSKPPAATEILGVCFAWGAADRAVKALNVSKLSEPLEWGREKDVEAMPRLLAQLHMAGQIYPEHSRATQRQAMALANTLLELPNLPRRLGAEACGRLLGTLRLLDPSLLTPIEPASQEYLDWKIRRRYRWHPYRHWIGIGWLAWQLDVAGMQVRVELDEPPSSLGALDPATRLFALSSIEGPSWVREQLERDFDTLANGAVTQSTFKMVSALAAAAKHQRVAQVLDANLPWDSVLSAKSGQLTALIPGIASDQLLRDFLSSHSAFPSLVERLRGEIETGNIGAHLVLAELERAGLALDESEVVQPR